VLALIALALTAVVRLYGAPLPGDLWLTERIQDLGRLRDNARVINFAGDWNWVPVTVATAFLLGRWLMPGMRTLDRAGARALFTFAAAFVLRYWSTILKKLVESPRPSSGAGVYVDQLRDSYGFPSGHVYGDVLFYGVLAAMAPALVPARLVLPLRALCVAIIVLSGPARVVVGAHWPSDIAGGYLWGAAALYGALSIGRWASRWW
jgi:membrane-associated phospholipid phosphatase